MSLHGVKRTRPTRDTVAEASTKYAKEQARITDYHTLWGQISDLRRTKDYGNPKLGELTGTLLSLNPEHPTCWSLRRHHLLSFSSSDPSEPISAPLKESYESELTLTMLALRKNPKAYPVWEHRKWVLGMLGSEGDWKGELRTVEGLLEKDGRNFHAWDYRRYLLQTLSHLPPSPSLPHPTPHSEIAFTTHHIHKSLSNFSAWHYRSKLLGATMGKERVTQELEVVRQAVWVDPGDQSAWGYQRWVMAQSEGLLGFNVAGTTADITLFRALTATDPGIYKTEITSLNELLEVEPGSKQVLLALITYERRLLEIQSFDALSDESLAVVKRCRERLDELAKVDPLRRRRYEDLKEVVGGKEV